MTSVQGVIKYCAIALAIALGITIIGSIVLSIAGIFSLLGDKGEIGEMKTYEVNGDVRSIEINVGAAELRVISGEEFSVESNIKKLNVKLKNGVLKIAEKSHLSLSYNGKPQLTVCIPEGTELEAFSLDAGAGTIFIESVSAERVELDLGAGKTDVGSLVATKKAEINGGAGRICVSDCRINALEADTGAGTMDITGVLTGKCGINIGVGKAELVLRGGESSYSFDVDKGIGKITIAGNEMSDGQKYGSGQNHIEIDGGVGSVTISFEN